MENTKFFKDLREVCYMKISPNSNIVTHIEEANDPLWLQDGTRERVLDEPK